MADKEVGFSVNQYDYEGDIYDKCVLLYIDENTIIRFDDSISLERFADDIKNMLDEIRANEI